MSDDPADSDPELDAAVLAADNEREKYVLDRLRIRRRMAIISFVQFLAGGAAIIIGGLLLPAWAPRIDHMATFLSLYFASLAGIIMAYWGLGTYERNTFGGMGGMGSTFGGSSGGYGGGGYGQPLGGYTGGAPHPRLVKSGAAPDEHHSPAGQ